MSLKKVILIGSLLVVLGEIFFVSMGMLIKILGETMPNHHLVFYRNVFAALIIAPFLLKQRIEHIKTKRIGMHILRSILGVLAMYCFFYALANIELANAMLLKLTGPIFIPIFAILWINEKVTLKTYIAIAIGFIGVIIFLNPSTEIQFASIVGLIGGALAAAAKVAIRKMSDTEPTARIVFYFAFFGALFSSIPIMTGEAYMPTYKEWMLLLALGLVGTCGQFCLTQAYRIAPASQVGPFTYSSLLWASLAGWLFWNEWPGINTFMGASLIITAGLVILYSKKK